jgi:hypothetical protein
MTVEQMRTELAAMLDPLDIPRSWTPRELEHYEFRRRLLDMLIRRARSAAALVAELEPKIAALQPYLPAMAAIRQRLADEYLALPKRDVRIRNFELSILALDRGLSVADDTGYTLNNLRLGLVMREAGVEWLGPVPEIDYRLAELTKRRDKAQAEWQAMLNTPVPEVATV